MAWGLIQANANRDLLRQEEEAAHLLPQALLFHLQNAVWVAGGNLDDVMMSKLCNPDIWLLQVGCCRTRKILKP